LHSPSVFPTTKSKKKNAHFNTNTDTAALFIQHKLSVQHIQKLSFKKLFEASGEKKKKKKKQSKRKERRKSLDC